MKWLTLTFASVILISTEGGLVDDPLAYVNPTSILYRHEGPIYCVNSCVGIPDGDYHSCKGCFYFATCSKDMLIDERKCAAFGKVWWNDYRKRCDFSSPSCHRLQGIPKSTTPNCVSNCLGMRNGDYHSCTSCRMYTTCTNGYTVVRRPCPWFLEWDDRMKMCRWVSSTCTLPRTLQDQVLWPLLK